MDWDSLQAWNIHAAISAGISKRSQRRDASCGDRPFVLAQWVGFRIPDDGKRGNVRQKNCQIGCSKTRSGGRRHFVAEKRGIVFAFRATALSYFYGSDLCDFPTDRESAIRDCS